MLELRRATANDARDIAEVHVAAWRWAYRGLLPDALLAALDPVERAGMWTRALGAPDSKTVAWMARSVGKTVGFVACGPALDGSDSGEIYAIYLLEEVAGSGVGRALFEKADASLRERGFASAVLW